MRAAIASTLVLASLAGCDGSTPTPADAGSDAAVCSQHDDCDDGVFCNGAEQCVAGTCTAGVAPCAAASCDEASGACLDECDADGDGRHAVACGGDDCDDEDPNRFPGNGEVCDAADHDEDCDVTTFGIRDSDGDDAPDAQCCNEDSCGSDCDDTRGGVHPSASEACNALDDDCDGTVDEGVLRSFYPDADMDGYGAMGAAPTMACNPPLGMVESATDCDDADQLRNPATSEVCDGIDNNCSGVADEAGTRTLYRDLDGDGHGDFSSSMPRDDCEIPDGYVPVGDDCDDGDATIHPGAVELCDRIDQNCSLISGAGGEDPSEDADADGHSPVGFGCSGGFPTDDCADDDRHTFPGATEACDGRDNDCDTVVDPAASVDAWCGAGAACDMGACVDRRTLSAGAGGCVILGGTLHCWGSNQYGQLGVGDTEPRPGAVAVAGLSAVVSVAIGGTTSGTTACAARADGTVTCWGAQRLLGEAAAADRLTPGPAVPGIAGAVEVAAGSQNVCARLRNGSVLCWGSNLAGQLGVDVPSASDTPIVVPGMDDAVELSVGSGFVCARRRDDTVACWGYNGGGQLGRGTTPGDTTIPAPVVGLAGVRQLDSGSDHTCALLETGEVRCWGRNLRGEIDGTHAGDAHTPRAVAGIGCIPVELDVGAAASCVRCDDGRVRCWGGGWVPSTGTVNTFGAPTPPTDVIGLDDATEIDVVGALGFAEDYGCARRASGGVVCWGSSPRGGLGDGGASFPRPVSALVGVTAVAAHRGITCAVVAGELSCWGSSTGDPDALLGAIDYAAPVSMGIGSVTAFDVAYAHICAISAGQLVCRGENSAGQLGDGTNTDRATPTPVIGLDSVTGVSISSSGFGCAREDDSDLFCWGSNTYGRLGIGSTVDSWTAAALPIDGLGIDVGSEFACAAQSTGVQCWGRNLSGELGNGTTSYAELSPVAVSDTTAADELALGDDFACVVAGGTVRCWGDNLSGQLGLGDATGRTVPTTVPGASGATGIAASGRSACAIMASGSVRCWGALMGSNVPVDVPILTGATDIVMSGYHACATTSDDRVWCWGDDNSFVALGRSGLIAVRDLP